MKTVTSQAQLFNYTDEVVKIYLKTILKRFRKMQTDLTQLKFDEIHKASVPEIVKYGYEDIRRECRNALLLVGKHSYSLVNDEGEELTDLWVDEYLRAYNPLTKYVYDNELERKRDRYLEAVISILLSNSAESTIPRETQTALHLWVRQFEQYADNITLQANLKAYQDCGIQFMRWQTAEDEKVCGECEDLDGKTFPIETIMSMLPAHYNCRCFAVPVVK